MQIMLLAAGIVSIIISQISSGVLLIGLTLVNAVIVIGMFANEIDTPWCAGGDRPKSLAYIMVRDFPGRPCPMKERKRRPEPISKNREGQPQILVSF